MKAFEDNSMTIGNTPLVRLKHIAPDYKLYAKIENRNPAHSVKCRIGANMVWAAEKAGKLKPGMSIVEPTSGNTGIALSFVGASRGYPVILTMPDTMSIERRKVMRALGAKVVLTEGAKGMKGAIEKAQQMVAESPDQYVTMGQFDNPANPEIHEQTTGPEIWADTDGEIDIFVSGVGTGGTITGVCRYLKKTQGKAITSVAVEPEASPVISQTLSNTEVKPGPHKIQGIGAGFVPANLDLSLVDRVEQVSNEESIKMAHELMTKEGILAGISCGAALTGALRVAAEPENRDRTIVVVLPDSGERYLSSILFEGMFEENVSP